MLIASLKDAIRNQAAEIERLQSQLKSLSTSHDEVRVCASSEPGRGLLQSRVAVSPVSQSRTHAHGNQVEALRAQVQSLTEQLAGAEEKRRDVEKEQEDLLVLLDELNGKRRRDKERMRAAGMDVSEDEDEGDDDDDEE